MDKIQRQLMELNYKIDRLYQILERVCRSNTSVAPEIKEELQKNSLSKLLDNDESIEVLLTNSREKSEHNLQKVKNTNVDLMTNHKDIINDDDDNFYQHYNCSQSQADYEISSELQVRRLTAQLTAAYHRIAALEDQLLAQRVH